MTPEEQAARIKQLEERLVAQSKALSALLTVIDEKNEAEIKQAIHDLLDQHPTAPDS